MHTNFELPEHLAERITAAGDRSIRANGEFVFYWMRTAIRAHENPALDVALAMGQALGRPVFVYHALSERYPHASDRHHTFILEGARDVSAECAARGIGYAFHLERPGHRNAALRLLAQRAALVVTETFPIPPLSDWTAQLAASIVCPVWTVDTACVVPMPLVPTLFTRAYAFRDATAGLRTTRLERPWRDVEPATAAFTPTLPFEPVKLDDADIPALVSRCAIDHGVAPVPHTRGGSVAGYARWQRFVASGGLKHYAARRNDPLLDGVSRLSAYLHYGMISPLRIARETAAISGDGPTKFLDELLVWREVAYAFCYRHPSPTTVAAIPLWAQDTLAAHESDAREIASWETLARARTGDALWDATQQSLLIHGELHNNVRMTWGKAIPGWTRNASDALTMLRALNHRFALDGRDPASYGGLLWCLGQFDRPFSPETPVLGSVRSRSTTQHAQRLNVETYTRHVQRSVSGRSPQIAVIGAGVGGLACARTLRDHGLSVVVFDKGRGVGGRTSTRRDAAGTFDHGAPSFVVRDPRLAQYVQSWQQDGVIEQVGEQTEQRWKATPSMNRLARHLANDLDVRLSTTITGLERAGSHWRLHMQRTTEVTDLAPPVSSELFDIVLLAAPAPQTVTLFETRNATDIPAVAEIVVAPLRRVIMTPQWCVMAALTSDDDAGARHIVLQATDAWTVEHLEHSREHVESLVRDQLSTPSPASFTDEEMPNISGIEFLRAHRWRFAHVTRGLAEDCLWSNDTQTGACGDWGALEDDASDDDRSRGVERAWLSGVALAGRLMGTL